VDVSAGGASRIGVPGSAGMSVVSMAVVLLLAAHPIRNGVRQPGGDAHRSVEYAL
jgi:hypothetical protein